MCKSGRVRAFRRIKYIYTAYYKTITYIAFISFSRNGFKDFPRNVVRTHTRRFLGEKNGDPAGSRFGDFVESLFFSINHMISKNISEYLLLRRAVQPARCVRGGVRAGRPPPRFLSATYAPVVVFICARRPRRMCVRREGEKLFFVLSILFIRRKRRITSDGRWTSSRNFAAGLIFRSVILT